MKRLLKSSKALAALSGILVMLTLVATGQVDGETATAAIAGLISVLVASIAYEDGARRPPQGDPP